MSLPVISGSEIERLIERAHSGTNLQNSQSETIKQAFSTSIIERYLVAAYLVFLSIFLARFFVNLRVVSGKSCGAKRVSYRTHSIYLVKEKIAPFTFFRRIFVNEIDFKPDSISNELIMHELGHKKELHSIDVVIIEFVQAIFWFNPVIYLIKNLIKDNHEFLADAFVINQGVSISDYSTQLVERTFKRPALVLASSFNYLLIKKRLIMLSNLGSKKNMALRILCVMPFLIAMFLLTGFQGSGQTSIVEPSGEIYADEILWSKEDQKVYLEGRDVKVVFGENDFTGSGRFSFLGKVDILVINGNAAPHDQSIDIKGKKCTIAELDKESIQKFTSKPNASGFEIITSK